MIETLRQRYPLGPQWCEPTTFVETTSILGVDFHLAGLIVRNPDGEAAAGSAGDLVETPLARAYFELLERASIVTMSSSNQRYLVARSADGRERGFVEIDSVSPSSGAPELWRYSKSNGVAAGCSWQEACARAEWELMERDRILRSWYGFHVPGRVDLPHGSVPSALNELYSFEAYTFGDSSNSNVEVGGVFAFPKLAEAPLAYGFGARPTLHGALATATSECMQRLGFLWGESIPFEQPQPSPTPDFHQEFYLWPEAHERLHRWLRGEHAGLGIELTSLRDESRSERRFVDLTPPELSSRLFVVKALSDAEVPLVFGRGHPRLGRHLPDGLLVHPIA